MSFCRDLGVGDRLVRVLADGRPAMGDVTIATPLGGMPGYLSSPGGDGPWPGVVVLHDGFGPIVASFGAKDRFLRAAPQRLDRAPEALGIDHDTRVYLDAGHAFLSQPEDEPGMAAGTLARITHAGYHEASAQDARRRIIAFFDAHLKT